MTSRIQWVLPGALLVLLILLVSPRISAQTLPWNPWNTAERVTANLGGFEVLDDVSAYEMGWELRFAARRYSILPSWLPELIPAVGAMASSRGALYTYAGFRADIDIGKRWIFSPGAATGLYYREGGKNLGSPLEFRTHAELSYRLPGDGRIGLCFYHLSNGGLFDFNPGTESLVLTYSARLRR